MNREDAYLELEVIYADLERELAVLRPLCRRSSRCCRFKDYGHQLWTTQLELDYLVEREGPPAAWTDGACPYLKEGLCGVRNHRMLGCRIFFCDPGYTEAMGPLYERYHRKIKDLHTKYAIPYQYTELLSALRPLG